MCEINTYIRVFLFTAVSYIVVLVLIGVYLMESVILEVRLAMNVILEKSDNDDDDHFVSEVGVGCSYYMTESFVYQD